MKTDYFNRQNLMLSKDTGEKIKNTSIAVIGTGAAGNEVLKDLALMGFGKFLIVDFDVVEDSNLSKSTLFGKEDIGKPKAQVAAETLRQCILHENPDIKYINGDLITDVGKGIFFDYDIIICCVDTANCRAYINDWCVRAGKPFFEIGFKNYQVNVSFFAPEGDTYPVCLREYMGQGSFDGKRNSCSGLKMKDTDLQVIPTIQFTAALSGSIVSMELIKYLEGRSTLKNKTMYYFGLTHEVMFQTFEPNPNCEIHKEAFMPVTPVMVSANATVREVLSVVEKAIGQHALMKLPEEFVISGRCNGCGKKMQINRRKSKLWDHERWCDECRENPEYGQHLDFGNEWHTVSEITSNSDAEILSMTMQQLGVPQDDVIDVLGLESEEPTLFHVRLMPKPGLKIKKGNHIPTFCIGGNVADFFQGEGEKQDVKELEAINEAFGKSDIHPQEENSDYTCYVKKSAVDDFISFANDIHRTSGHEAIGVIVGYYCTDSRNPNHKLAIGTKFLPAHGCATQVTCEMSVEDGIRFSDYCIKHKMLPVVWIHSHPGFGAFYSGTDTNTLLTKYNGPHQAGIVIDNLRYQTKAYKCIDGKKKEIPYFLYEIQETGGLSILTQDRHPLLKIKASSACPDVHTEDKGGGGKEAASPEEGDSQAEPSAVRKPPANAPDIRRFRMKSFRIKRQYNTLKNVITNLITKIKIIKRHGNFENRQQTALLPKMQQTH